MYAWFVDGNSIDQGLFRSIDAGATWTQIDESGLTDCSGPAPNPQNEIGCGTQQGTYNLALTAVPNGSATDLYAGAINIYKCTLYTTTAAALPRIIAGYRARGYKFVTVGELLGVPGSVPFG